MHLPLFCDGEKYELAFSSMTQAPSLPNVMHTFSPSEVNFFSKLAFSLSLRSSPCTRNNALASASLAKSKRTCFSMNWHNCSRCCSTQEGSDRESAIWLRFNFPCSAVNCKIFVPKLPPSKYPSRYMNFACASKYLSIWFGCNRAALPRCVAKLRWASGEMKTIHCPV